MGLNPIPEPLPHQAVGEENESAFPGKPSRQTDSSTVPENITAGSQGRAVNAAHAAGSAFGRVVLAARDFFRRAQPRGKTSQNTAPNKVQEIQQRASASAGKTGLSASEAYQEANNKMSGALGEASPPSAESTEALPTLAQQLADEYPLAIIAGTAGAAFLAGVLLRIWRSNRDE